MTSWIRTSNFTSLAMFLVWFTLCSLFDLLIPSAQRPPLKASELSGLSSTHWDNATETRLQALGLEQGPEFLAGGQTAPTVNIQRLHHRLIIISIGVGGLLAYQMITLKLLTGLGEGYRGCSPQSAPPKANIWSLSFC